jgi:hypothetical protein
MRSQPAICIRQAIAAEPEACRHLRRAEGARRPPGKPGPKYQLDAKHRLERDGASRTRTRRPPGSRPEGRGRRARPPRPRRWPKRRGPLRAQRGSTHPTPKLAVDWRKSRRRHSRRTTFLVCSSTVSSTYWFDTRVCRRRLPVRAPMCCYTCRVALRGLPGRAGGSLRAHARTSSSSQIGPARSLATGAGKSERAVYRAAVRLLTSRTSATSASPTSFSCTLEP